MAPGIRGNLRPDLLGEVLHLTAGDVPGLGAGESARLRVKAVLDANHPECVAVDGHWIGPDGLVARATVLVRLAALPRAAVVPVGGAWWPS